VVGPDDQEAQRISALATGREVHVFVEETTLLRWEDLDVDPDRLGFPAGHPARNPFLAVPVRVGGAVFGNLYLTQKRNGEPFTHTDVEVLQALAGVAGLAIGNARLAEFAEEARSWFQAGTEVVTTLLSGAEPEDVLRSIAQR